MLCSERWASDKSDFGIETTYTGSACGKIILAGEHAVVYGKHAIAVPVPVAVTCTVCRRRDQMQRLRVIPWGLETWHPVDACPEALRGCIQAILEKMGLRAEGFELDIMPSVPRGSGLGASAAMAVSIARAFREAFGLHLDECGINDVGFASEQVAHGTPSGVDNTVATFARPLLFRKTPPVKSFITLGAPLSLVVGFSGKPGMTHAMVRAVAALKQDKPDFVERIMSDIDALALAGRASLEEGNGPELGYIMNENHRLLQALHVSSLELDALVALARGCGALGAKLTGGGGGGAMVALCAGNESDLIDAFSSAGFLAYAAFVGQDL